MQRIATDISQDNQDFEMLISDIMRNTLRPFKCVAIICDEIYYDTFKGPFFQSIKAYVTFLIVNSQHDKSQNDKSYLGALQILVDDAEDLLSPHNETQETLIMAKRQDCQTYIILISNGLQVGRLLRFGHRYRVLDTRAKFIFLYDQRLYEKNLLYLWNRIVNVIFIHENVGTKSRGRTKEAIPWFEITTVPFPSPIKEYYFPRRLDIWRQSKFRSGTDLFRDKTSDLRNQTLKVVTSEHIPATTKIRSPTFKTVKSILGSGEFGFSGLEVQILATISKKMNFRPSVYEAKNATSELWGVRKTDGHYSGLFGDMINNKADIALGDLYYTSSILEMMDLSVPYYTQCLTFLTPESLTNNFWKTLILPFKPLMWTAVIVCMLLIGVVFYVLARFHHHINSDQHRRKLDVNQFKKKKILTLPIQPYVEKLPPHVKYALMKNQFKTTKVEGQPEGLFLFGNMTNSILYTFSILMMVSLPKVPSGWSLRILTGCYWVYCLLVVVAYRASMTAILANPAPRVTVDTLQELVASKLPCGGWGEINRDFFKTSLDPASQAIGSKFEMINDSDAAVDRVASGDFAFYENAFYLKHASVKRQLRLQMHQNSGSNIGDRNVHIMTDCIINMPISIGLQKNSPIVGRFNKYIRRVIEAGLVRKWLDDVMQTTLNSENVISQKSTKALMSLQKMIGAIVALFIGYLLSFLVLVGELIHFEFYVKKHPHFDKYSKCIRQK